jgi:ATP-dependent helicase STH1/SNF2
MEVKANHGPFMVVVPLSTITNWSYEMDKWAPNMKKLIYKGKKSERPQL